jgi:hypothetical protein
MTAAPSRQLLWPLQNRIRTEAKDHDPFALQAHPGIFRLMKFCPFHVSRIGERIDCTNCSSRLVFLASTSFPALGSQ